MLAMMALQAAHANSTAQLMLQATSVVTMVSVSSELETQKLQCACATQDTQGQLARLCALA